MAQPRRIALFGGTFDPIHQGHLEIATKAIDLLSLEAVFFIPCRQSPHKEQLPRASDADRHEMLTTATRPFPWARVDPIELQKPPPSYTWETVAAFRERFPENTELHLLIGEDQWIKLSGWKNHQYLAETVHFIVVGRDRQPKPRPGYRARFIEGNHPASSNEIRSKLSMGLEPDWLPDTVSRFILEKGLYSSLP